MQTASSPSAHVRRRRMVLAALGLFVSGSLVVVSARVVYLYDSAQLEILKRRSYFAGQKALLEAAKPQWAAHHFQSHVQTAELDAHLDRAIGPHSSGAERLTSEQLAKAQEAARLFLQGYAAGRYDDYSRFRKPRPNYRISTERAAGLRESREKFNPTPPDGLSDEEQLEWHWKAGIVNGRGYFQGIAFETLAAGFAVLEGDKPPSNWGLLPGASNVTDMFHFAPYYLYPDQPRRGVTPNAPVKIMTVVCIVKPPAPDYPLPVMYKSYWSESAVMWLPLELSVGSQRGRKVRPVF